MHGLPRILQTRADFDEALRMVRAGEAHPPRLFEHFAGLIESSKHYVFDKVLAEGQAPDGGLPAYCVLEPTEQTPARVQLMQSINPDARLFELGFTVASVQALMAEMEAL